MTAERYRSPYADALLYEQTRPRYQWDVGSEEVFVSQRLRSLRGEADPWVQALELGCGTGRFTSILATHAAHVHATDPSPGMIEYCRASLPHLTNCRFHLATAETAIAAEQFVGCDLVAAFWSITYPLQALFELEVDAEGRVQQRAPNEVGYTRVQRFLKAFFQPGRTYVALAFDPSSVEQRWVTAQWTEIGDFPGGSREALLDLLFWHLFGLRTDGATVNVRRIRGHLVCQDKVDLERVFLVHHLRGLLPAARGRDWLRARLLEDMRELRLPSGGYRVPAGMHLIEVAIPAPTGPPS
ncbi:MAG: methyltransferase domain-containing protein [Egibacteraceae bacterium]